MQWLVLIVGLCLLSVAFVLVATLGFSAARGDRPGVHAALLFSVPTLVAAISLLFLAGMMFGGV
ncbi:MAG: hypothetical protein Q8K20_13990 [Gemmobacter sp.]|nr:hypothetical protein [Gemmobacter sp.]